MCERSFVLIFFQFLVYERGAFTKPNNIIPLNENIKYLRCAKKLYKVEIKRNQFNLIKSK